MICGSFRVQGASAQPGCQSHCQGHRVEAVCGMEVRAACSAEPRGVTPAPFPPPAPTETTVALTLAIRWPGWPEWSFGNLDFQVGLSEPP